MCELQWHAERRRKLIDQHVEGKGIQSKSHITGQNITQHMTWHHNTWHDITTHDMTSHGMAWHDKRTRESIFPISILGITLSLTTACWSWFLSPDTFWRCTPLHCSNTDTCRELSFPQTLFATLARRRSLNRSLLSLSSSSAAWRVWRAVSCLLLRAVRDEEWASRWSSRWRVWCWIWLSRATCGK